MSELFYALSGAAYLIGCAALGAAIWAAIECGYWIFCKITGRDY
jgi:hypothetical protein